MWYEAMLLEVHFQSRTLRLQYPDGNTESDVPFDEVRQQVTIPLTSVNLCVSKQKYFTPRDPISLNTHLKIVSVLEVFDPFFFRYYCRHFRSTRYLVPSMTNGLMVT